MKNFTKFFTVLVLGLSISSGIIAAESNENTISEINKESAETGTSAIRGRIVDNTGMILPGANIYIDKIKTGTTSDINGYYLLSNLKPGIYSLKISYVGYESQTVEVDLTKKRTVELDITMNDNTQLKEVVIKSAMDAHRAAINAQKSELGIVNVVSADQVGKFPDSNIGDALKRISGINVQYDQGEARYGQIRGTSPDFSSVTIDGDRLPSAEADIRNVQLDLIPADMIQTIEVNKVITSDMSGDAIGGSINLVTKNSPYKKVITATAGSGYNFISEKPQLNLGFSYGDRYLNNKLGIMVAASYQYAPGGSHNTEFEWDKDDNGKTFIKDYQIRRYYVTRERQSYSASFDYKLNENNKLYFKGIFNNRNDWENRYRTRLKKVDENGTGDVLIQTKAGTPNNKSARLERQRTMDFDLGGEHLFGKLSSKWNVAYARASEKRPNERYITYQLKDQTFNFDLSDEKKPFATPQAGSKMVLDDDFGLKEISEEQKEVTEQDVKGKINFTLPLYNGTFGNKLKFGAKYVYKSKDKDHDFYTYKPVDKDAFNRECLTNHLTNQNTSNFMAGKKYKPGTFVDKKYVGDLNLHDRNSFTEEKDQSELADNYTASEAVTAGYIRFDQKIGKNLKATAGLRVEETHLEYKGRRYDSAEDIAKKTGNSKNNYTDWLPSVLLKYDITDEFKVRASFTKTLVRPRYKYLIPSITIDRKDNEITIGNPDLKPTHSYNFDLSTDYYFKSIGLVTAGIFYKDIKDFSVGQNTSDYVYEGTTYDEAHQFVNAGNAKLFGVEIDYERDFGFISPAFKCIGFYGNYTYTYSKVEDFNFEGRENEKDLSLPGSPEHTGNASLYFDKNGFNIRVSYNFASSFISDEEDAMGKTSFYDRYYDAVNYLDLNAGYTFGNKFKTTFYVDANNLLNQPLRYYQGTKDRTMQAEYYGIKINAGVKIHL